MMDNQQKVVEFGKHSDDLMSDNCLDNSSKETIQKEKELLTQRWNAIVDKTNKNQERYTIALFSLVSFRLGKH